jgi:hypothetical protein
MKRSGGRAPARTLESSASEPLPEESLLGGGLTCGHRQGSIV